MQGGGSGSGSTEGKEQGWSLQFKDRAAGEVLKLGEEVGESWEEMPGLGPGQETGQSWG